MKKAFNRRGMYLGKKDNDLVYMEKASWDCGWYWGFGYIEIYEPRKQEQHTHTHYNSVIFTKDDSRDYIYHINSYLDESVLNDTDAWKLSELMKSFYILRETAGLFHRGSAGMTTLGDDYLKDEELYNRINKVLIPGVINRVYTLLVPESELKDLLINIEV